MEHTVRIDLPVVLPDVIDERDACVERLERYLTGQRGILDAHVVTEPDRSARRCSDSFQ